MLFRKVLNVKNKHSIVESSHYSGYTGTGQRERERERDGAKPALAGLYSQPRPGILLEGRMADAREGPQSFIDNTRGNTKM